jgi:hypothetical protein
MKERDRYLKFKNCMNCPARRGEYCSIKVLFIPREVIEGKVRFPDGCPAKPMPRPCPRNTRPLYEWEG